MLKTFRLRSDSENRVLGRDIVAMESNFAQNQNVAHLDAARNSGREDFSEYVAHLQLHMALHARNLVPTFNPTSTDSRDQLLRQTQADFEKQVSRQII